MELTCSRRVKRMACPSGFSMSVTLPTEITSCEKHKPARGLGKPLINLSQIFLWAETPASCCTNNDGLLIVYENGGSRITTFATNIHLQHCTLKKMKNTNLMFEKAQ